MNRSWQEALGCVLGKWRSPPTPYAHGSQARGHGVDCVRFVDAVYQELHGVSLPPLPMFPGDTSAHSGIAATKVALKIRDRFPSDYLPTNTTPEPGDTLAVRCPGQRWEGHVLIVGPDPRYLWHASKPIGVCYTGWGSDWTLMRLLRPREKHLWA